MEHPLIDKCPSCGSPSSKSFLDLTDLFLTQEEFTLSKCEECTLVYTRHVPINVGAYYKSDEYISHSEKKTLLSSVYKTVQGITLNSKKRLVSRFSSEKTLLDYGAGKGDFSSYMINSGFTVTSYEPDPDARILAGEKNGISLVDSIKNIPKNTIDTITMWHVLEHIPNPNDVLKELKQKLKKNGTLIIAVPNYQSFDAEYYGKFWAAYDVPRHVTHYSVDSMKLLLERNGLNIIQTNPMWFDSTYVSLLSEKYKALNTGGHPNMVNQLKAILIGTISNLFTIGNTNRCSSLIYVTKHQ
ncbi:MAG: 2-polyprenyl-3-methyl-5-hydroxy-6-metoxy-1,4-benzoquinol methylase [Flavobacteriales bacterium]